MKKLISLLLTALYTLPLFSESLITGLLNGPSAVPAAYLIENKTQMKSASLDFQLFATADTELPKLLKGEIDLAVLPPNAAAKIWNKTNGNIVALAVIGEVNLALLTTDQNAVSLKDLIGKTVYCAGRGATPDYLFRYILEKNQIQYSEEKGDKNKVHLDFSIPNAELAASLISGKATYILVPEPFATVALTKGKTAGVKPVFDLSAEYSKENFPMTLIVANKKQLAIKQQAVEEFLKLYENAVIWTNSNPEKAGLLVEKHTLGLTASITTAAIPQSHYVFQKASAAQKQIEKLLQIFNRLNSESIGGVMPSQDFYAQPLE